MKIASVDVKNRDQKRCSLDTESMQLLLTIGLAAYDTDSESTMINILEENDDYTFGVKHQGKIV